MSLRSYNDSEVYFIAYLKFLEETKNPANAFLETERFISEDTSNENEGKDAYSSLNAIYADGQKIVAFNRYNEKMKKSVSDPEREYYKMCFKASDKRIIISSEPIDDSKDWMDIGNGRILEAYIYDGKIKYELI